MVHAVLASAAGTLHKMRNQALSNPDTKLNALFKAELAKKNLSIEGWQRCIEVSAQAPQIFRGHAPILDCLCIETKKKCKVPVEVKASRPRSLKRRSAKDVGMRAPFDVFSDNYALRHQLQLCLQNAALDNSKPRGYIAYVDVDKPSIKLVKLNPALWALANSGE